MTIEEIEKAIKFYGHCRYMFCYSFMKSYPSKHKWIQDKWEKNSNDALNYIKEAIEQYKEQNDN